MPKNRPVELNYDKNDGKFGPTPKKVFVNGQDTIVFTLKKGATPDRKLKITIKDHEHFPAEGLERTGTAPLEVLVKGTFSEKTTYKCELFEKDGTPIASVDGETGGEIEPDIPGGIGH